jgi:DNA polymerase-1
MNCTSCSLHKTRKNIVPGAGNVASPVYFLGEAPGMHEDAMGQPFVGKAGLLLTRMLKEANLNRDDFYIDNTVKCRPVLVKGAKLENRPPTAEEIELCSVHLEAVLAANKPKVIVATGNVPLKYLLKDRAINISKARGQFYWSDKYQCYIFPVLHPASILRKFEYYNITVLDFCRLKKFIDDGYTLGPKLATDYKLVDNAARLTTVLDTLEKQPAFAFDVETTTLSHVDSDIICLNLSWEIGKGYVIPFMKVFDAKNNVSKDCYWESDVMAQLLKRLKAIFAKPDVIKVAHNIKFDAKVLRKYGVVACNPTFDTLLAHYILDENLKGMRRLKHLAWMHTDMGGYERGLEQYQKDHKLGGACFPIPYSFLLPYGAGDSDCTFRLYKIFSEQLEKEKLMKLFTKLVMPLSTVYTETEYHGIRVNVAYLKQLETEYSTKLTDMELDIQAVAKKEMNIRSVKQLRTLLFGDLGFVSKKKTKTDKDSTDMDVLESLAKKHEAPRKILEYRKIHKVYSTYINGLEYDATHHVHTEYNLATTTTGRLSSDSPNLQNIPRASTIKNIFTAEPGHTLVEGDFAQIEFRLWAHYANDTKMMQDIAAGLDIHRKVASIVFKLPPEQISDEQRSVAKSTVFGLMYGRGATAISEEHGISITQAEKLASTFFAMYPVAKRWLSIIVTQARNSMGLSNYFGRKRRFVTFNSPDSEVQSFTERQAKNFLMQSTAADITNYTAVRMHSIKEQYGAVLVLNVHDSLVYDVPEENSLAFAKVLKEEAEKPLENIQVPIKMEIKIGPQWGTLQKVDIK